MAKAPSPAFPFYPNDWLSSTQIALMTPAEEGAYIRLLCIAWNEPDCGLPDDEEQLARLSRLGADWNKVSYNRVIACFVKRGERLYNERLLIEWKKQKEYKKKASMAGKKGMQTRWGQASEGNGDSDKVGYKEVITSLLGRDNISPSPSSSNNKEYTAIFDCWLSCDLQKHRTLTAKMQTKIRSAMKDGYSIEDICQAIRNYAEVVNSPKYYWTKKWPLELFLERGLSRFVNEAMPQVQYLNSNNNYPESKPAFVICPACHRDYDSAKGPCPRCK